MRWEELLLRITDIRMRILNEWKESCARRNSNKKTSLEKREGKKPTDSGGEKKQKGKIKVGMVKKNSKFPKKLSEYQTSQMASNLVN